MKLQMGKRHWTPIALILGCVAPAFLPAQSSPANTPNPAQENNAVGGKLSVDLVTVKQDELGLTLRHGNVVAGSEQVLLDGRKLRRGDDYSIDNDSGIVYLLCENRPGQSVSINYRYDAAHPHSGGGRDWRYRFRAVAHAVRGKHTRFHGRLRAGREKS